MNIDHRRGSFAKGVCGGLSSSTGRYAKTCRPNSHRAPCSCERLEPGGSRGAGDDNPGCECDLNRVEQARDEGSQCRAYFVVTNKNAANYQELKLDLVLFRPDGVIGRRFAVDLAPLKSNKRTVKLFELADTACDDVGSFLINEIMGCRTDSGPVADCLDGIAVSSLTKAQLTK